MTLSKTLLAMTHEVTKVNKEKGWYDDARTFGDLIALLHSEASEALEAFRKYGLEDVTNVGQVAATPKPEGVGSEFADILIRLLDMCARYGVDLEEEYERKVAYNKTRTYRHGGKKL